MARSYLKCDRTNDFGYGEIAVNRIPSTSREVLYGRSWSLVGTSEHSCMLKYICQWKMQQSCDLHFTWMYYLCYVIGRSASTRSKTSGKRRLCGKPWYFLMRRWNAIIPPTLTYCRIIKDMGQYTWQIQKAIQQFTFWSVCDARIRRG